MAASSNYFRVKDEAVFRAWAKKCNLGVTEDGHDGDKTFSIFVDDDDDDSSWPFSGYDEETEEDFDVDVSGELAKHLHDGSVAVLFEGGAGNAVAFGHAEAINNRGESVNIGLQDIYSQARHLGKEIL